MVFNDLLMQFQADVPRRPGHPAEGRRDDGPRRRLRGRPRGRLLGRGRGPARELGEGRRVAAEDGRRPARQGVRARGRRPSRGPSTGSTNLPSWTRQHGPGAPRAPGLVICKRGVNVSEDAAAYVGLVVVSHSRLIAEGTAELAGQMAGPEVRIVPAGGHGRRRDRHRRRADRRGDRRGGRRGGRRRARRPRQRGPVDRAPRSSCWTTPSSVRLAEGPDRRGRRHRRRPGEHRLVARRGARGGRGRRDPAQGVE